MTVELRHRHPHWGGILGEGGAFLSLPSSDPESAVVFRGSKPLCQEYSLVLEAKAIEHTVQESGDSWVVAVVPALAHQAYDEISRYSAERNVPRSLPVRFEPYSGAAVGAIGYVLILLLTAYCAGLELFGIDWLSAGPLDAGAVSEWWRALTALTLHLDQEHLLGNLLFGVFAGIAAGRLLGPGVAWASILSAGTLANIVEILIAPPTHRAVGASTAVFAALVRVGAADRGDLLADIVGGGHGARGRARTRARISLRGRRGLALRPFWAAPRSSRQALADRRGHRRAFAGMRGVAGGAPPRRLGARAPGSRQPRISRPRLKRASRAGRGFPRAALPSGAAERVPRGRRAPVA